MGNLNLFLKQNQKVKGNTKYAATKSLCDEKGKPLEWTIKAISTKENERIRQDCTKEVPVPGRAGMYRQKVDSDLYVARVLCASIVEPNLNDKELQDSYGVMKPEELVKEMVPEAGEYNALLEFVQQYSGFDITMEDKVNEAKN